MPPQAFPPHSLAIAALAIQVVVCMQMFVIARAPGWHRARAFAWVAFTAGLYSTMYAIGTWQIRPLKEQAVHWLFSLVFGTLHAAAWCRFAWAPDARSWGDVPVWLYRTVVTVVGLVVGVALSGQAVDIQHPVHVVVPSLRIDHVQPRTSPLGSAAMVLIGVLYAITLIGLLHRRREPGYRLVSLGYGAFLVCVVLEALIAHFGWSLLFPAPIGFVIATVPITALVQRQFSTDAERLAWLSSSLRGQLASRTEERDLAREALIRQEQVTSVGRLANGVGHQLSNPLQHLALAVDELRRLPVVHTPDVERHLHDIGQSVVRMEEVVRRLRDLTDLDQRVTTRFPLARAVRNAMTLVGAPWQGRVVMRSTFDEPPGEVVGDERAIVRVVAAVLLNACEAAVRGNGSGASPRVDVHGRTGMDGTVTLDIRDTGPGFPADVLAHIGEPFLPGHDNLGLGLHTAHRVLHAHGGSVTVGNLPSGGALVSFVFPPPAESPLADGQRFARDDVSAPAVSATHTARLTSPDDVHRPPPRVLVVEDELLVRQGFVRLLERHGYEVRHAANGREAVACLARESVDVVLTDLMMPEMSGVELAQHLATHYPGLRERLVVVCGGAVTQDAVAFLNSTPLFLLEKPVAAADLLRVVAAALEQPTTPV